MITKFEKTGSFNVLSERGRKSVSEEGMQKVVFQVKRINLPTYAIEPISII